MTPGLRRFAVFVLLSAAGNARADLGTAIEFYNPSINHYFVTAYPEEAAALDAGTNVKGWKRTGGQFSVFTEASGGLAAVCRFFGTPGVGANSHFYTADPAECAKVKTLPAWTFEGIAFYIPLPSNGSCGGNWPVYRSYYSDQVSDFNHRFTADLTAHVRMNARRGDILEGIVMCAPVSDEEREADVVRFLEQASLGPTEALVREVKGKGIEKWLDEQLAMNVTRFTQFPYVDWWTPPAPRCTDDNTAPVTPDKWCLLNQGWSAVTREFFRQSVTAPDQLRLRMAHVWHQIFVNSSQGGMWDAHANANFHQRLRDGAFETYESLLSRFSLSPQLGTYQSWVRNVPERDGIRPNENFARELLQLFTIGTTELNEDGTAKRDGNGQPIPTYNQSDVETLARILTGYAYPTHPGASPDFWNNWPPYWIGDMIPFDAYHDRGAKSALNGRIAMPAGGTAAGEVTALLHILSMHPNVPPFISRQLIQKMVTSSPTPGYVTRVAAVFKDNGKGVRGDLAAVTRAILLDPEARGARKIDREYGRLREPALFWTAMLRALDVTTDGLAVQNATNGSGQQVFSSPSVFNYYPAEYALAGGVPAPEFGIYTSLEFLNRANQVNDLLYNVDQSWTNWGPQPSLANALGTPSPSLAAFLTDAANPEALVTRLDRLFMHGTLPTATRKTIVNAVNKVSAVNALRRVKLALNLMLVSIDYQVQK